jgi:hypothetical protein
MIRRMGPIVQRYDKLDDGRVALSMVIGDNPAMIKNLTLSLWIFLASALASADELTLYFIHSPLGLDWHRPSDIARSIMFNELAAQITGRGHSAGHVYIGLNCGSSQVMAGMTNSDDSEFSKVIFKEKRGLGTLFYTFHGRIQRTEEVALDINRRLQDGEINFMTFLIQPSSCQRSMQYLEEFSARGYDQFYGLANRPLHGEGAGCSAFGTSFLTVSGIEESELTDAWSQSLRVPLKYIGDPTTHRTVNFLKLVSSIDGWARANQPHRPIFFWDPDQMYNWVDAVVSGRLETALPVQTAMKVNARGLLVDYTHIPTPNRPIWESEN